MDLKEREICLFQAMKIEWKNELQGKETQIRKCQFQVEETLKIKAWTSEVQKKLIAKLNKDLKDLHENKEEIELEFNDKLVGKAGEMQPLEAKFAQETFKLHGIIGKQKRAMNSL